MFWGYTDEIFSSGPLFVGSINTFVMLIFYVLVPKYLFVSGEFSSRTIYKFIITFIVGYVFVIVVNNWAFQYALDHLNFGHFEKSYKYVTQMRGDLKTRIFKLLTKLDGIQIFQYFRIAWFPVSAKMLLQYVGKLEEMKKIKAQNFNFELGLLKSQINPKFVSNMLESIKSNALTNNNLALETILKLSNTTRYTLYETDELLVPIQKEIDFLINYIDLRETQLGEGFNVNFKLKIQESDQSLKITPLLFLPILDKAFHCIKTNCDIDLNIEGNLLQFYVNADKKMNCESLNIDKTIEQINLQYPQKHSKEYIENEHTFDFKLTLNLA